MQTACAINAILFSADKLIMDKTFSIEKEFYGTPLRRLSGYVLDRLFTVLVQSGGLILGAIVASMMLGKDVPTKTVQSAISGGMTLGWVFWGLVAWFLNYGILQGILGSTIGKMIVGTRVINGDGEAVGIVKSLVRTVAYAVSALPLCLGFFAIFWSKRSQAWHDAICSTYVVRRDFAVSVSANTDQIDLFEDEKIKAA